MHQKKEWHHVTTGSYGDTMLFGVKIFKYSWHDTGEEVEVLDPLQNNPYRAYVYTVSIKRRTYQFATLEITNSMWVFYTSDE